MMQSNTISTTKSITQQNNDAANLIDIGSYKAALAILSQALATVQMELNNNNNSSSSSSSSSVDDTDEQQETSSAERYIINSYHQQQSPSEQHQEQEQRNKMSIVVDQFEEQDYYEEDKDFIYRRPIRTVSDIPQEEEMYVMSVILVFNMALTHHLIGLRTNNKSNEEQKQLRGALKLYELVFCMQMKSDVLCMSTTCTLALMNNSAQIYKSINRQRKATKYFKHLLSSLMMMVEKGEADTLQELDGFLYNVTSRFILTKRAAPAA